MEKNIPVSASITQEMKDFLNKFNLSPSILLQEKILEKMNKNNSVVNESSKQIVLREERLKDLNFAKNLFKNSLKPEGDLDKKRRHYETAITLIQKKWNLSKNLICNFTERDSDLIDEPTELNEQKEQESPLDIVNDFYSTSVYMDASKNKIKEVNRSVD